MIHRTGVGLTATVCVELLLIHKRTTAVMFPKHVACEFVGFREWACPPVLWAQIRINPHQSATLFSSAGTVGKVQPVVCGWCYLLMGRLLTRTCRVMQVSSGSCPSCNEVFRVLHIMFRAIPLLWGYLTSLSSLCMDLQYSIWNCL